MRKVVKEVKWRVTLTTAQGPIEKVLDAPSQDIAISRAMRSFPGQQFSDVDAKTLDPQTNVPTGQASQQNQLPNQVQPLQPIRQMLSPAEVLQAKQQQVARESSAIVIDPMRLKYPYSITLPAIFRGVLRETSPVMITMNNGQYRVIIENLKEMRAFLGKLTTHRNRDAVKVIADGIRSSTRD
jgi:hypothetical protein